jgi:K+-transporting ATPase ATPase A chain
MIWLVPLLIVATSIAAAVLCGRYLAWVFDGRYRPWPWLRRVEGIVDTGPQRWKQYAIALLSFNVVMFGFSFVVLALQGLLPFNPDHKGQLAPTTILHTTISFFGNNSLQHYAGEQHLSYFSQLVAIVWNMFVGGATSLCALTAVIRGLRGDRHLGNFYLDLWRGVAYVLLPLSVVTGVILIAAGTPMTFGGTQAITTLEGGEQFLARGPVAALVPIKNLASVGGGFFGTNTAHPFEGPNASSNFLQAISILLLPCAVIFMFGHMIQRPREARTLLIVVVLLFLGMISWTVYWEAIQESPSPQGRPEWTKGREGIDLPAVVALPVDQAPGGNLEGKELRFTLAASAAYAATTTAVACGSVDCMHDSLNAPASLAPLCGMWLNCVFGGKGVGLLNLLIFLIVAVFLTGLMVGRTPEYLGRKVEAREMKLAMLACLIHPILILAPTGLFAATPWGSEAAGNPGPHGLTEVLYEFSSASSGNGSSMQGLGNTWGLNDPALNRNRPAPYSPHWDIATALVILFSRFVPILAAMALAASLGAKVSTTPTIGTLRTDTVTFSLVLLVVILLLGALVFLPAAVLGPVAEHYGPVPFGG